MGNLVSIIILVQDRYDLVKRCIDSIIEHTRNPYELVIIIQGPVEKRITDYLWELKTPIKSIIVQNFENSGVTPGRNQGMGLATGDYLLFFDDDAYVDDQIGFMIPEYHYIDWLQRMLRYFELPNVGVVGQSGTLINPKNMGVFYTPNDGSIYVDVAQGYCFMFSREVMNKIGYLNPAYGKFWHEESDYALHAKSEGFKVVNSGYIGVFHAGSGSGDDGSYVAKIQYLFNKWGKAFPRILEKEF